MEQTSKLGNLLKQLRGDMSLREAGERIGVSHNYIRLLEVGFDPRTQKEIKPSAESLKKFAAAYGYSYEKLMDTAGYLEENDDIPYEVVGQAVEIPVLSGISPELPLFDPANIVGYRKVASDSMRVGENFFWHVEDNSMEELHIAAGSHVLVTKKDWVENGEVALVRVEGKVIIRKVKHMDNKIMLLAAKHGIDPILLPREQVKFIGKIKSATIDF